MARQIIDRGVQISMRDGVKLTADVYRPDDNEKHPALIMTIMASRNNSTLVGGNLFGPLPMVDQGYAIVVVEARGRSDSEGMWKPWIEDGKDGYDRVEWAAAQPWCDGAVGVYGNCHLMYPALATAVENPPHLKAALLYMGATNPHNGWIYSNGALELSFNLYWNGGSPSASDIAARDPAVVQEVQDSLQKFYSNKAGSANTLPLTDMMVQPYWKEFLSHPAYDDYWKAVDLLRRVDEIKVPILHISGWYDLMLRGHLDLNRALHTQGDPDLRQHHRVILGPWDHETYLGFRMSHTGDRDFGPGCMTGPALISGVANQWFDRWLKGKETPFMPGSGARYFSTGDNSWKEISSWPPASTQTNFYLHSAGRANTKFGDGSLDTERPGSEPPDSYVYDPMDPVPTAGGRTLLTIPAGIRNQALIEERADVLVYSTPILTAPVSIAGQVMLTLYAASSAVDTDFTAKLVDVEPDGYCANVAEGIVRARYRNGDDHEEFLTPGEVTKFEIDLWDVAHTFNPGHRIRLEVSSSNFPHFDRNLNSEVVPALGGLEDVQKAAQQVFHNSQYPSHLALPVV